MKHPIKLGLCTLAICMALSDASAQQENVSPETEGSTVLDVITVKAKRAKRVSKGATGLPLEIKETPQTISTISQDEMTDFGATGSNEALRLGTGINVEQYETNRAVFNARGFEVQLTQIDGLGMTNDYGTVVGQQDTFLFERIELIRGANGLLTGVGNASGTINYVRKRPTNEDSGEIGFSAGSYDLLRGTFDYNKVLTEDGRWAGRLVVAHEDRDSHLRALNDRRTTIYGVVDGQIGERGVLTLGLTNQVAKQDAPMWGSLTLNYLDGSMAEFDDSSSTSQDWAYWDTDSASGFVEYLHQLNSDWELKLTYNRREADEDVRLLYAFSLLGGLNPDNTGLVAWPYAGYVSTENDLLDANVSGWFEAFGREHAMIVGLSHSAQETATDILNYDTALYQFQPLPAFPYTGDAYAEPIWGSRTPSSDGEQALTRFYAAARVALNERIKAILGLNAVKLQREGNSRYGDLVSVTEYPDTEEVSPYFGLTYDFTPDVLGYVSYSDIFQNQDQIDVDGVYLDPMRGVNQEIGVKAEWMDGKLLTTLALFSAEQRGLATFAGINDQGSYYYAPADVESKGAEFEATGRLGEHVNLVAGLTHLDLSGPDGGSIYEWIPRNVANLRIDARLPSLPTLRAGIGARWQSDVRKNGGASQDAFVLINAFAAYELTDAITLRLNANNLFDKKYVGGLAYGAIYGAPRNFALTLDYKL